MATGPVQRSPKLRGRPRGRVAAGSLALGVSSLVAVGGLASPVSAQAPTAVSECTGSPSSTNMTGSISDFPPSETFLWFAAIKRADGSVNRFQGFTISTDSTGAGAIGLSAAFGPVPLQVRFAVYRDLNGNRRWDPATDDTVYSGSGTITDCPQNVTLAPK